MKHTEGFCHMEYSSECGKKISIWNSRDGVTPFICFIEGVEYKHSNWNNDKQNASYIPRVGDYLFVDSTLEDLIDERFIWWDTNANSIDSFAVKTFHAHYGYDRNKTCRLLAEEDLIRNGEPPPHLLVATKDFVRGWICHKQMLITAMDSIQKKYKI